MAEVVIATGWTWQHTRRHMDLHRYAAMQRLWRRSPPLQAMVQAYLGIEGQQPEPVGPRTAADEELAIQQFAANFAAAGGVIN